MNLTFIEIIFWLLLVDSVLANVVAWGFEAWYIKNCRLFSRWFPIGRGWTAYYFILVLWIGYLTFY
jgi:hypothetical protein